MHLPPHAAPEGAPERVKVEVERGLEEVFTGITSLGVVGLLAWGNLVKKEGLEDAELEPVHLLWVGLGVAALLVVVLSFVLRKFTDVHLIIDRGAGAIFEHSRFLWRLRTRKVSEASGIAAIGVDSSHQSERYGEFWRYQVILIDSQGRTTPLSLPEDHHPSLFSKRQQARECSALDRLNSHVKLYAFLLGCPYFEGRFRYQLKIQKLDGRLQFSFIGPQEEHVYLGALLILGLVLILAFGAWLLFETGRSNPWFGN